MDPSPPSPPTPALPTDKPAELLPLVYDHLRAIAQERMNLERPGHTLQATALVHEAFLRLTRDPTIQFRGRAHFFHAAADAMRRILIEHARARATIKRAGNRNRLPLSVIDLAADADSAQIEALDDALRRLEGTEPDAAAVVRLRFYAGLSGDQTADALGLSPRQVDRLWSYARALLFRSLEQADH